MVKIILICIFTLVVGLVGWKLTHRQAQIPTHAKTPIEQILPNANGLQRTDLITNMFPVHMLNAKPKDLYSAFLQKWGVIPIIEINKEEDVIWARFSRSGVDTLNLLANTYGYTAKEKDQKVTFVKESPQLQVLSPDILRLTTEEGTLGESLWKTLQAAKLDFLICIPRYISDSTSKPESIALTLKTHGLYAGQSQSGVILIYLAPRPNLE